MSRKYSDLTLLKYLLYEVHQLSDLFAFDYFSHLDEEQTWLMIQSAAELADRDMFPYYQEMDRIGAHYDGKGNVSTPDQLKTIIQNAAEQGWIGAFASMDYGGMQLPAMVFSSAQHIFQAANNGVQGYLGLSAGAARLITSFGTAEQVKTFVEPIFAGTWQGTMALTEPQAGSSLTDLTASAQLTSAGHYLIKGQKIFISAGQHEACDNFVHLTLARIEGAPAGVKGISLFIIPKFRPTADGSLEYNDVFCAGEFQKMGQRCYSTTHLAFGDQNDCHGYLLGEPHKGLHYMFQMMNEARIGVGQTASSVALAAYLSALQYAKERTQGRLPSEKDPLKEPVPIIRHADVQRMLFTQKAIAEGALCLAMECNKLFDLEHVLTGDEKAKNKLLLEILTPIVKTYSAEHGLRAASLAIQVLGGYGYTVDFPAQQYFRDLKIMAIYEGTTGIQSLDLLGRKVTMENGAAAQILGETIMKTIEDSREYDALKEAGRELGLYLNMWQETTIQLLGHLKAGNLERYLADATIYMEMCSQIVIGWQWLKMAESAARLAAQNNTFYSQEFLQSRIQVLEFFMRYELPIVASHKKVLLDDKWLTNFQEWDLF